MEILKLIGVVVVIVGFALKFDAMATVVVAGLVTGLVAGMSPMEILNTLGSAFLTNRTATMFVLTLAVIGLCERNGLKDKAVDFISKFKSATTGKVVSIYQVIRTVAAALSIRMSGHPQFIRPIVNPMAQGAAVARFEKVDEKSEDQIKAVAAGSENYGNFFGQDCFMGNSGTMLIVTTLTTQGFAVDALGVAMWSIPVAVIALIVGIARNLYFDRTLDRRLGQHIEKGGTGK